MIEPLFHQTSLRKLFKDDVLDTTVPLNGSSILFRDRPVPGDNNGIIDVGSDEDRSVATHVLIVPYGKTSEDAITLKCEVDAYAPVIASHDSSLNFWLPLRVLSHIFLNTSSDPALSPPNSGLPGSLVGPDYWFVKLMPVPFLTLSAYNPIERACFGPYEDAPNSLGVGYIVVPTMGCRYIRIHLSILDASGLAVNALWGPLSMSHGRR